MIRGTSAQKSPESVRLGQVWHPSPLGVRGAGASSLVVLSSSGCVEQCCTLSKHQDGARLEGTGRVQHNAAIHWLEPGHMTILTAKKHGKCSLFWKAVCPAKFGVSVTIEGVNKRWTPTSHLCLSLFLGPHVRPYIDPD